jgi:hypothetical protein
MKRAVRDSRRWGGACLWHFTLFLVLKPSQFSKNCPTSAVKRHTPEKHRVRAGGDNKGQTKGLSFVVDRPRTSISLSIAQRELTGNLLNCELLGH